MALHTARMWQASAEPMEQVWISLGSNVGDRMGHLRRALGGLQMLGRVFAVSDSYESEPVGYADQPWFLNAVAGLELAESRRPEDLLQALLDIEQAMGRVRGAPGEIAKGPRVIDLDIILYGSRIIEAPALRIPHPEMHRRRFVLEPLVQLAPEVMHPVLRQSASQLLEAVAHEHAVRRFAPLSAQGQPSGGTGRRCD